MPIRASLLIHPVKGGFYAITASLPSSSHPVPTSISASHAFTPRRMASTASTPRKERIVILGSGWAGYAFARTLNPAKYERILISPRSYFVFTPLLASTAVGTLEFRAVLEPVRRLHLDAFHQGWADSVDFARKRIRVEENSADDLAAPHALTAGGRREGGVAQGQMFDVEYDKLVVAVGSYSQTFGIEGVRDHANLLRDVGDARRIRLKVLQCFEKCALPTTSDELKRRLLHFAVVGGGPTGIEFAAELHDLIHDDLSKLYPELKDFVSITVYDIAPKVLPMFDKELAKYATDLFKRQGIQVKTEHHLERIRRDDDGSLRLKIKEYGDEEVGAGVVVWSTGLMQNPLVKKLLSKDLSVPSVSEKTLHFRKDPKTGGFLTDPHLRVQISDSPDSSASSSTPDSSDTPKTPSVLPDVFAIGDCSVIEHESFPATAQVASQQALYLANRLNKGDLEASPFKFRNWGTLAYLGSWRAIHQSSADEVKGRAAWVLWRTAYLTMSMSVRNKIMVPVYWVMTWIFGRDISRF